jgi:hypothetical protein
MASVAYLTEPEQPGEQSAGHGEASVSQERHKDVFVDTVVPKNLTDDDGSEDTQD